jgi:acetoin utilization protein AcuB
MRVGERMRREPAVAGLRDSLGQARRRLGHHGIRDLPIVDRSTLVGVLSAADVALAQPSAATTLIVGEIHFRLSSISIERVARTDITAVGRRTPLAEAIRLMRARDLATVPVVSGHELIGVLTEEDLLELLADLLTTDTSLGPNAARSSRSRI